MNSYVTGTLSHRLGTLQGGETTSIAKSDWPLEWGPKEASVQFSSVVQSCLTLCDPMNHSMPALPVHHQLPESTQTHIHQVDDAIQPSHPLSSCSPPALNLSQHQGLFQWVSSLHQVAKVLEFQPQHQSFQWRTKEAWPGTDTCLQKWLAFSIPFLKQQGMMMFPFGRKKPKSHFTPQITANESIHRRNHSVERKTVHTEERKIIEWGVSDFALSKPSPGCPTKDSTKNN